jgi:hypothetical protein
VRRAVRLFAMRSAARIISNGGVITAFTEIVFCTTTKAPWQYRAGLHGNVVYIAVGRQALEH